MLKVEFELTEEQQELQSELFDTLKAIVQQDKYPSDVCVMVLCNLLGNLCGNTSYPLLAVGATTVLTSRYAHQTAHSLKDKKE